MVRPSRPSRCFSRRRRATSPSQTRSQWPDAASNASKRSRPYSRRASGDGLDDPAYADLPRSRLRSVVGDEAVAARCSSGGREVARAVGADAAAVVAEAGTALALELYCAYAGARSHPAPDPDARSLHVHHDRQAVRIERGLGAPVGEAQPGLKARPDGGGTRARPRQVVVEQVLRIAA